MPFIGRREDQSIYGLWSVRQWPGQEWMADDAPEVVAALADAEPPAPTVAQKLGAMGITADDLRDFLGLQ